MTGRFVFSNDQNVIFQTASKLSQKSRCNKFAIAKTLVSGLILNIGLSSLSLAGVIFGKEEGAEKELVSAPESVKFYGQVQADYITYPPLPLYKFIIPESGSQSGPQEENNKKPFFLQKIPQNARDMSAFLVQVQLGVRAEHKTPYGNIFSQASLQIDHMLGVQDPSHLLTDRLAAQSGTQGATQLGTQAYLETAYVTWGPWTLGRTRSFFDFYADAYNYQMLRGSNSRAHVLAYQYPLGARAWLVASLEQRFMRNLWVGPQREVSESLYRSPLLPDLVLALQKEFSWGKMHFAAAWHLQKFPRKQERNALSPLTGSEEKHKAVSQLPNAYTSCSTWAVQAGVQWQIPKWKAGHHFVLQASYTQGALAYNQITSGQWNWGNGFLNLMLPAYEGVLTAGGEGHLPKSFNILGLVRRKLKDHWQSVSSASYTYVKYGAETRLFSWAEWRVGTQIIWMPKPNFSIGLESMYIRVQLFHPYLTALPETLGQKKGYYVTHIRAVRSF